MVLKLPRTEQKKKKSNKAPELARSPIKTAYKQSSGAAGPIPYTVLAAEK